jgi:hypothetical protein
MRFDKSIDPALSQEGGGEVRMSGAQAEKIVQEAIEAHGGMTLWNSTESLDVEISARGFLFTAKRRPVLRRVRMRASTREPRFFLFDHPKPGQTSELAGRDEVRIVDSNGDVISRRTDPRAAFSGLRRLVSWDDLDFIYFAGYATWNYLTTPFLLARPGFSFEAIGPLPGDMARFVPVRVTFPDDIPTHSRQQVLYFDGQRLLRRLDYTAEVVGRWAHAAHLCDEYRNFNGLRIPTRRRVLPLLFGLTPLPGPTLVSIDVHSLILNKART